MLLCQEPELEEQKNTLSCYNAKIVSAKLILNGWERAYKELREEVIRIYDEKRAKQNLV
jgi:hypothetical protein